MPPGADAAPANVRSLSDPPLSLLKSQLEGMRAAAAALEHAGPLERLRLARVLGEQQLVFNQLVLAALEDLLQGKK